MNLLGKSKDELRALLESLGEPGYRAAQIYHALYAERRSDFAAMSNLPAALRGRLAREASIEFPRVGRRHPCYLKDENGDRDREVVQFPKRLRLHSA